MDADSLLEELGVLLALKDCRWTRELNDRLVDPTMDSKIHLPMRAIALIRQKNLFPTLHFERIHEELAGML